MGKTWICLDCGRGFSAKQARERHRERACDGSGAPKIQHQKNRVNVEHHIETSVERRSETSGKGTEEPDGEPPKDVKIGELALGTLQSLLGGQIIATVNAQLSAKLEGELKQNQVVVQNKEPDTAGSTGAAENKESKIDIVWLSAIISRN